MKMHIRTLRRIIKEEVEKVSLEKSPPTNKIVLVNDGSFNPVHRGHINVTLAAESFAESMGFEVVALYMCPKHESWLEKKFSDRSDILPTEDRLEMLEDAVGGTGIEVTDWELNQSSYKDNRQLRDHFESIHPGSTYVMIVGEDYGSCSPMPCFEEENGTWQLRLPRTEGLSSTKIRQAARKGGGLQDIALSKVQKYMSSRYSHPSA